MASSVGVNAVGSAMFLFWPLLCICVVAALIGSGGYTGCHYERARRHHFPPLPNTGGASPALIPIEVSGPECLDVRVYFARTRNKWRNNNRMCRNQQLVKGASSYRRCTLYIFRSGFVYIGWFATLHLKSGKRRMPIVFYNEGLRFDG